MIIECSRCHRAEVEADTAWLTARITCEDAVTSLRLCADCQHESGWGPRDFVQAIAEAVRFPPKKTKDENERTQPVLDVGHHDWTHLPGYPDQRSYLISLKLRAEGLRLMKKLRERGTR